MDIDTAIYGDLVGLVLEMINSILTHTLKHNPELIYALLHKRDSFIQFRMHSRYIDLVENIDKVFVIADCRLSVVLILDASLGHVILSRETA